MKSSLASNIFVIIMTFFVSISHARSQPLDCKIIASGQGTPGASGQHGNSASLSAQDITEGYRLIGGGCKQAQPPGGGFGYPELAAPNGNSYECLVRTPDNKGTFVTAFAVACRLPVGAKFTNFGLGGGIVTIARISTDASSSFLSPIPFSFRICNTSTLIDASTDLPQVMTIWSNVDNPVTLPFGTCFEVDQPTRLAFQTPMNVAATVYGTYWVFQKGTFSGRAISSLTFGTNGKIGLGNPMKAEFKCQQFDLSGPHRTDYWGYCQAASSWPEGKNYRVCFDDGVTYPSGLHMVLDKGLLAQDDGKGDLTQNSVADGGCRDLYQLNNVYFLMKDPGGQPIKDFSLSYREYIE